MDLASGLVSKEQPYIGRLTRLGVAAVERGKGLQLLKEVSALIFGGTRDWHLGDHLAGAVARSGLDLAELDRAIVGPVSEWSCNGSTGPGSKSARFGSVWQECE